MSGMQDNYYDIILTACGVKGISGSFRCVGGCVAKGGGGALLFVKYVWFQFDSFPVLRSQYPHYNHNKHPQHCPRLN